MPTNTHSRRFFLTLAAAAAFAFQAPAAVDPALAALIPADATIVSGVNVGQAKTSSFGRFVLSQMNVDDSGAQNFINETGFDPRRDLSDVMVATVGATADKTQAVILGRGVFNPARIFNAAKSHGATVSTYLGVDVASHDDGAIAFIDASLAVAGNTKVVKAVLEQRAQNAKKLPDSVMKKMQELSAANDVWFYSAASPAEFFGTKMADPNVGNAMKDGLMQAVLQAAGGIKFADKEARVSGEAMTRSDKDAQALADVFRFLAQIVQSNGQSKGMPNDVAALLGKMQLTTDGSVMKVSMSIPEDLLERVFTNKAPARRARAALR